VIVISGTGALRCNISVRAKSSRLTPALIYVTARGGVMRYPVPSAVAALELDHQLQLRPPNNRAGFVPSAERSGYRTAHIATPSGP
jgi:hypothetical protein